jgi:predicted secreted hydrolase
MRARLPAALCLLSTACGLLAAGCSRADAPVEASLAVTEAMAGDTVGYARAVAPRPFVWPGDHGPHPAFKTEWWYLTGNLDAADGSGRRFGYQFTVFRVALSPDSLARASEWAARQLYMAHVTLSDVEAGRFYHAERFERGAAGLAGAQADPFRVWLADLDFRRVEGPALDGAFPMRLRAASEDGAAYDLTLGPLKPPVLQGEQGLSRKGPEAGNASYYYSLTRLATTGTVTVEGEAIPVEGLSWMDREWSTSALGSGLVGWDWFSLHLDPSPGSGQAGRDLMLYQLRRRDGTADPFSQGTVVDPDGTARSLSADQFTLTAEGTWRSPRGGAYPSRWRVRVPSEGLDLLVTPALADQELTGTVRYWEGAVTVEGTATGRGYLEMTGYADVVGQSARPVPGG